MSYGSLPVSDRRIIVPHHRRSLAWVIVVVIIILTIAGWTPEQITAILIALGVIPVLGAAKTKASS
jgi:hypothetical protein